jgi:hypothetical protein
VARDGEEPDLGADAIDLASGAEARGRITSERAGEIDGGNFAAHGLNPMSRQTAAAIRCHCKFA